MIYSQFIADMQVYSQSHGHAKHKYVFDTLTTDELYDDPKYKKYIFGLGNETKQPQELKHKD